MELGADDLMLFARVVEEGSLSRAAEKLAVPKSTVSRRVAALESRLGERLLLRTTRRLTVTELGRTVLEHARRVSEDVAAAQALAQHRQAEPQGRLRVSMAADLANLLLAPTLVAFAQRYPAISLELDLSPRFVDLVAENFDLAIRMGALQEDASLAARRLLVLDTALYASPAYLARAGTPERPEDLMTHQVLQPRGRRGDVAPWELHRGAERWSGLPPGRVSLNSLEVLLRMALHGGGITLAHDHFAAPYVQRGELARVLPEWRLAPSHGWAVFPGRRLMPARTRVFIDFLVAAFGECPANVASGVPWRV